VGAALPAPEAPPPEPQGSGAAQLAPAEALPERAQDTLELAARQAAARQAVARQAAARQAAEAAAGARPAILWINVARIASTS
jgi:type IV secretory pathway VirB10-like protein